MGLNGDGYSDFALLSDTASGLVTYIIYGREDGFDTDGVIAANKFAALAVSSLDGSTGFAVRGAVNSRGDYTLARAGDVNNDGGDDLLLGGNNGEGLCSLWFS